MAIAAHQPVVGRLAAALVERVVLTPEEVGEITKDGWGRHSLNATACPASFAITAP